MFNSARGSVKLEHGSASSSNYESFGLVRQSDSLKRKPEEPLKESDRSGSESDVQITEEVWRSKRKKAKKDKKEKKAKKSKHKHKRKRHSSTSSDSSVEVLDTKNVTPSVELNVDNYQFQKSVRTTGVVVRNQIPLSSRFPASFLENYYTKPNYDLATRYFGKNTTDKLAKPPTENRFRRRGKRRISSFVPLSLRPLGIGEDFSDDSADEFQEGMSMDEMVAARTGARAGFEFLTLEERRKLVQGELKRREDDPSAWREFLEFEKSAHNQQAVAAGKSADSMKPAYLERRVEILRKAISKVPKDAKVEFMLEQLETMSELKGPMDREVAQLWQQIEAIDTAVTRLAGILAGTFVSHKALPGTEDFLVEAVCCRVRLLLEAGLHFKAVACVQALLEFVCFMPPELAGQPLHRKVAEFGKFWDSSAPRVGDMDSVGWCNWVELKPADDQSPVEELRQLQEDERYALTQTTALSDRPEERLCVVWNALERVRVSTSWRPVRRLFQGNAAEFNDRYVSFNDVKPSLVLLENPLKMQKLVFKLLQVLGASFPGLDDSTPSGILEEILPEATYESSLPLYQFDDFLLGLLRSLSSVPSLNRERVLVAMVMTTAKCLQRNCSPTAASLRDLRELHLALPALSEESTHLSLLALMEAIADVCGMGQSFAGLRLEEVDNGVRMNERLLVVDTVVKYFPSNPCAMAPSVERQIVLFAALVLCRRLPSSQAHQLNAALNRRRFLTLLVLGTAHSHFRDTSKAISDADIAQAAQLWKSAFEKMRHNEKVETAHDRVSFINSSLDSVFQLYTTFLFEVDGLDPFTAPELVQFADSSRGRATFRLDFLAELSSVHNVVFRDYCNLAYKSFSAFPRHLKLYRHLVRCFRMKGCAVLSAQSVKPRNEAERRVLGLCRIAATYKNLLSVRDQDDTEIVAAGYETMLRNHLDEYAPLVSDGLEPDSFIWRLWMSIARDSRQLTKAQEVFYRALRHCPYSKMVMLDAARNPNAPDSLVKEMLDLCNKTGVCMFSLAEEADALRTNSLKQARK